MARNYKVSLEELEAATRVEPDDLVESVDTEAAPQPDPRGPEPDRDWFAAGG